ncbi:hypothetical protein ACS5PU_12150 [Pedobacter sp. GSP4]|uniref:hypothetical protein n=1 Tax=Pedobacter sp. GSP4 TaxID=3453716 RepID=UPI003EEFB203
MSLPQICEWPNANYIKLSAAIARETKVYISKNTLKRIFGKLKTEDSYYPQRATLDALAIFIGYQDWDHFRSSKEQANNPEKEAYTPADEAFGKKRFIMSEGFIFSVLATIMIIFMVFMFFFKSSKPSPSDFNLVCVNPEGANAHSAIFKLEGNKENQDTSTLMLDFDDRFKMPITLKEPNVIHHFEGPGWYRTILRHKGVAIDTSIVYIKSKGWKSYLNGPYNVYGRNVLKQFDGTIAGMKGFSWADAAKAGRDTIKPFFLNFVNIKKTNIDGDNFEMLATVKMSDNVKRGRCSDIHFNIYGDVESDYVGVANPECVAWADAKFSEQVVTGLWKDLRSLGTDFSNGGNVKLRVENKKVRFYINGKLAYVTKYNNKLGKVSGVKILFSGLGEVHAFSLRDLKTGETF